MVFRDVLRELIPFSVLKEEGAVAAAAAAVSIAGEIVANGQFA